jgi:hypothetical protein
MPNTAVKRSSHEFVGQRLRLAALLFVSCVPALQAAPEISDRSPDKKYALWQKYADTQPYHGDVKLIDAKSGQPVIILDSEVEPFSKKLLWTRDSQRFAYFNDSRLDGPGFTKVYFRDGTTFEEVKLPDLPAPPLPAMTASKSASEARAKVEPLRWADTGELVLESELISKEWGRTALEITVAFDHEHHAALTSSKPEPPSIIDYFLLLPADTFETPPASCLYVMRANGNMIDKRNGYMSYPADGAQPEFEVALFRYRDGRPLLAVCSGELEEADSVSLHFFELAANGKMQLVNRWMFPVPDDGYDPASGATRDNWEFKVPHAGKTITIQSQKGHKVLYKLTWNGERFEKEK